MKDSLLKEMRSDVKENLNDELWMVFLALPIEPFYFYDLRAEITHNGVFKEVVLVNEKDVLKRIRPFLFLI